MRTASIHGIGYMHIRQWAARWGRLAVPVWVVLSLLVLACVILSPVLMAAPDKGMQLGVDVDMRWLVDKHKRLGIEDVASLPDSTFTRLHAPLTEGFSRDVHWLKVDAPIVPAEPDASRGEGLWLCVLPGYIDEVTLYQRKDGEWHEQRRGDMVPMGERIQVRQLLFKLREGEPFYLRVRSTTPINVDAWVWRTSGLLTHLSRVEWASGVHQGINLLLVLLIFGAALMLRQRSLGLLAVGAAIMLEHGAADRGYLQLWLPASMYPWGDVVLKAGTLMLPIALVLQFRDTLTANSRWRRIDSWVLALGIAPLLALPSIPLDVYQDWGWLGIASTWLISILFAYASWCNLIDQGWMPETVLMAFPTTLYSFMGVYVTGVYMGLAPAPNIETSVLWQLNSSLVCMMIAMVVGASLIRQWRQSRVRQRQLVETLEKSELALEERVRQRTSELLHARNALQSALHSERDMRVEQRQFFNLVNHEFRTPLAVMSATAMEQQASPTTDLDEQVARATRIRRACQRLSLLVDNCLLNDRLGALPFAPQMKSVLIDALLGDAVQLAQWSTRHTLELDVAPYPDVWRCDPTLVSIALSNLVDNAIKHARTGRIAIRVDRRAAGPLEFHVDDEGPGMAKSVAEHIFERYERGEGAAEAKGFGLGLWVARRIARQHGGDVVLGVSPLGGTRFTLTLGAVRGGFTFRGESKD